MRPLALALLLFPAALSAQPAPAGDAVAGLAEAFADGTAPKADAPADQAAAVRAAQALFKKEPKSPKLGDAVFQAYQKLFPKADRDDILARARLAYGLSSADDFQQTMRTMAQRADRLPPDQAKVMQARLARMRSAFGEMSGGDGALTGGGVTAGTANEAGRRQALEKYKNTPAGPQVKIVRNEPPPLTTPRPLNAGRQPQLKPGEISFEGVTLNPSQRRRVEAELGTLKDVLDADGLQGYVTQTDKKQILSAWGSAVAHGVDATGGIPDMCGTVNKFRDILLQGRESRNGTTRVAEHWGEMAVGSYCVHPYAAIGASFFWNTFSITKGQLLRSYNYLVHDGPLPPAGNYWGEAMNKSLVTESAAAGWASALQDADKQSAASGVVKTLKLDEFLAYVGQEGVLTTAGQMKDRYTQ
jgi:hypothetical protein